MATAMDRLWTLKARDVMSRQVVTVRATDSMDLARRLLAENQISGLPVVDHEGRCVGMLSVADFARLASPSGTVADHMSPTLQTIPSDATLVETARTMCGSHVHRLPVLDSAGRPAGMITSLDLVSALVLAIDEQKQPGTG